MYSVQAGAMADNVTEIVQCRVRSQALDGRLR